MCTFILSRSFLPQVRLLTLRILSQFEAELPPHSEVPPSSQDPRPRAIRRFHPCLFFSAQGEESVEALPVFALCLHAELVPATVQDYREKLLHLRKLRHDLVQRSLPQGPPTAFQQVRFI